MFCHRIRKCGLQIAFLSEATVTHHDRESFKDYMLHLYRWGYHAPFVRGNIPELKYGFIFHNRISTLTFRLPLIVVGYTFFLWKSWILERPFAITCSLPQILIGRFAYAWGVAKGTIEKNRLDRSTSLEDDGIN